MKQVLKLSLFITTVALVAACGGGAKEEKGALGDLKVKLEELKKQKTTVETEIRKVEEAIEKLDSTAVKKAKLVSLTTIGADTFSHLY
jgi:hypothetical protein